MELITLVLGSSVLLLIAWATWWTYDRFFADYDDDDDGNGGPEGNNNSQVGPSSSSSSLEGSPSHSSDLLLRRGRIHNLMTDATRGKRPVSTLIVLGSGGHTAEMLQLISGLDLGEKYSPISFLVASSDTHSVSKLKSHPLVGQRLSRLAADSWEISYISRSRQVGQGYLSSVISTLEAIREAISLCNRLRPELVLCNGPGTCIPICIAVKLIQFCRFRSPPPPPSPPEATNTVQESSSPPPSSESSIPRNASDDDIEPPPPLLQPQSHPSIGDHDHDQKDHDRHRRHQNPKGDLYRCKVVFVESICRTRTLSLSGKLCYYLNLADNVLVQWPALALTYPKAAHRGILV